MSSPESPDNDESIDEILHELDALSEAGSSEEFKDLLTLRDWLMPPSAKKEVEDDHVDKLAITTDETTYSEIIDNTEPVETFSSEESTIDTPQLEAPEEQLLLPSPTSIAPPETIEINDETDDEVGEAETSSYTSSAEDEEALQELGAILLGIDPSQANSTGSDLDELRNLLVNPETARLDYLEQRLDDLLNRSSEVAEVLPAAIGKSDYEEIAAALRGHVEQCLNQSVHNNTKVFADAIYPIIGPAIRQSILKTLKEMLQSLNQAVEQGLSIRGLLWRFQSWRTGVPFREIVLRNTVTYRVEQVFLIHKETGLLLQHVCLPDIEQQRDSDAVSAMLTAIQDFINDSFSTNGEQEDLETVEIGSNTVFLTHNPFVTLAGVIRGVPPNDLREIFEAALKEIQIRFHRLIETFDGDASKLMGTKSILESCLVSQTEEKPLASKRLIFILVLSAAIFSYWSYTSYLVHEKVKAYLDTLQQTDGIVIIDSTYTGQHLYIEGLHDPFAKDPEEIAREFNLNTKELTANWENYQSLTPKIMLQRAKQILSPPEKITLTIKNTTLYASGLTSPEWQKKFNALGRFVPGIEKLDSSGLQYIDDFLLAQVINILKPPASVKLSVDKEILTLKGMAPVTWVQQFPKKIAVIKGLKSYNNHLNKQEALAFDKLRAELEKTSVDFDSAKENQFKTLLSKFQRFLKLSKTLNIASKINVLFYRDGSDGASLYKKRQARELIQYFQQQLPQQYFVSKEQNAKDTELMQKLGFSIETRTPKDYLRDLTLTQQSLDILQPPASVYFEVNDGILMISGDAKEQWQQQVNSKIALLKNLKSVRYDDFRIDEHQGLRKLVAEIEEIEIYFEHQEEFAPQQENVLAELANKFKQLLQLSELLKQKTVINIVGHTDQLGSQNFNRKLAKKRAEQVISILKQQKIEVADFHAKIGEIKASVDTEAEMHKRKVSFNIEVIPLAVYERNLALRKQVFSQLKAPETVKLLLDDDVLTISGEADFAWYEETLKVLKSFDGLKDYQFNLVINEEKLYYQFVNKIQKTEIIFEHQDILNDTEKLKLESLAQDLNQLSSVSNQLHKQFKLELSSYILRKNSSYRKKAETRAMTVIEQLKALNIDESIFNETQYRATTSPEQENKITFTIR